LTAALCVRAAGAEILIEMAGSLTGPYAWVGEQMERDAALAVSDLNAAGGVLEQAVAAADIQKL
jgi:branched-chain amino acid transport system substrate-binding protein